MKEIPIGYQPTGINPVFVGAWGQREDIYSGPHS
jgi:hypothetical protein